MYQLIISSQFNRLMAANRQIEIKKKIAKYYWKSSKAQTTYSGKTRWHLKANQLSPAIRILNTLQNASKPS